MKKFFVILIVLLCFLAVRLAAAPTTANVSLVIKNVLSSQLAQQAMAQSAANANAAACPYVVTEAPAVPQVKPAAVAKTTGLLSFLRRFRFW